MSTLYAFRGRLQANFTARPLLWGALVVVFLCGVVLWGRTFSTQGAVRSAGALAREVGAPSSPPAAIAGTLASDSAEVPLAGFDAPPASMSVAWSVAALVLVLFVLYASLWALRRFAAQRTLGSGRTVLQVSAPVRLGANQTLHVVRFGSRHLLVGASHAGLTVLATDHDDGLSLAPAGSAGPSFQDALNRAEMSAREQ